ncbi:UDP-N-acetylglucosamine 4,6-dehydratase [Collibacillus ludicampi]|uniref:UDP-N-acetylglucosamine 4,6-dehydratase n=1 Tax=Collibacillus ludicampi TaxID=2771369 RepID=A0AAV4LDJ5_9BACL|nr:UDP-N-acetylglucosamine 4,6-dehydratase family protein [Collibacillus ludicampi]GIM45492.1 UDP-N-acetylglucosamine 4,6-dehydratase [Collibacillus ludicampi]
MFKGKNILITGGTGSIGGEIVRQLLSMGPNVIRIFSRDEGKQFSMQQELTEYDNIRYLIGDIRDRERLSFALQDIDFVFHTAGLKHVPACEYNPFEAIKTNVLGTQNLIDCCLEHNVEKVIAISTDKAANPANTMGTTKLLMEKLVTAANLYRGKKRTVFSCVRFGNVLGSRGSVVPLFIQQALARKPLTVTDLEMTRFMMSISQAVRLVFRAAEASEGGEIFILKMPVLKIADLADAIRFMVAEERNETPVPIEVIGLRAGEKLYEELMTEDEAKRAYEFEDMFVIVPDSVENLTTWNKKGIPLTHRTRYSSLDEVLLTPAQVKDLIASEIGKQLDLLKEKS